MVGRVKRLTVAASLAAFAVMAVSAAPVSAFEPIEGVWRTETSTEGEYLIQRSGPGTFKMTTIRGNDHCLPDESGFRARVTEQMELRGSGFEYVYDPVYRFPDCSIDGIGQGIARIVSTAPRYRHVLCGARPGTGPPQFDAEYRPTDSDTACRFAVRIRPRCGRCGRLRSSAYRGSRPARAVRGCGGGSRRCGCSTRPTSRSSRSGSSSAARCSTATTTRGSCGAGCGCGSPAGNREYRCWCEPPATSGSTSRADTGPACPAGDRPRR